MHVRRDRHRESASLLLLIGALISGCIAKPTPTPIPLPTTSPMPTETFTALPATPTPTLLPTSAMTVTLTPGPYLQAVDPGDRIRPPGNDIDRSDELTLTLLIIPGMTPDVGTTHKPGRCFTMKTRVLTTTAVDWRHHCTLGALGRTGVPATSSITVVEGREVVVGTAHTILPKADHDAEEVRYGWDAPSGCYAVRVTHIDPATGAAGVFTSPIVGVDSSPGGTPVTNLHFDAVTQIWLDHETPSPPPLATCIAP